MWCIIRDIKFSKTELTTEEINNWVHSFSAQQLEVQGWTHEMLVANCQRYSNMVLYVHSQIAALIHYHKPADEILEILFLGTSPFCQSQGLMSELLTEFLASQVDKTIWLECREDNLKARHLYAKKGFQEVGRRKAYYKDGSAAILFNY
jgi:[ribosomal protein S18]-alanine N-acetyltransferase